MGSRPSRQLQQQQHHPRLPQRSAEVPASTVSASSSPTPRVPLQSSSAIASGPADSPLRSNSRVGVPEGRTVHFSLPQDLIEEEDQESDIAPAPEDLLGGDTASSLQSSLVGDCLSDEQLRKIRLSLGHLETVLGISFDVERVARSAQIVNLRANENIYVCGAESTAMYVVDSGALEVCTSGGETVIARLLAGDFCGEVSVLFDVKCTARVQTECSSTLLLLPKDVLLASMVGDLDHDKLLDWFVINIEVTHADDLVGHKCVRKSTDSYATPIQDFLNMQPSTQTVKAVGPCLAAMLDRATLYHAFYG